MPFSNNDNNTQDQITTNDPSLINSMDNFDLKVSDYYEEEYQKVLALYQKIKDPQELSNLS